MKRISVREFQLHASKYIKILENESGIVLTQYNKEIALLSKYGQELILPNRGVGSPKEFEKITNSLTEEPEPKSMCDRQFCKQRSEGKYSVITNDGTEEWSGSLCTFHWNLARREGELHAL